MCKDKKKNITSELNEENKIDIFDDYMDNEFLDAVEAEEKKKRGEISQEEYEKLKFIKEAREKVIGHDT